jgi:hypothetical protein
VAVRASEWSCRQVSEALGCCPRAASRRIEAFERRAAAILTALAELEPRAARRPGDLAQAVLAVLRTGGKLAAADEPTLKRLLTAMARDHCGNSCAR